MGYARDVPQTASPEILEHFKQGFECWNGGQLDLMQDMYAEDGEFDLSAVFTDTTPFRGHDSMRRQWDEMWETWEGIRMDPLEVFDIGGGRLSSALTHQHCTASRCGKDEARWKRCLCFTR